MPIDLFTACLVIAAIGAAMVQQVDRWINPQAYR